MRRADSLEKTLMLGKIEGKRRRGWHRMRWLDSIIDSMGMNLSKLRKIVEDREAWRAAIWGVTNSWTRLSDWTTVNHSAYAYSLQQVSGLLSLPITMWACQLFFSQAGRPAFSRLPIVSTCTVRATQIQRSQLVRCLVLPSSEPMGCSYRTLNPTF